MDSDLESAILSLVGDSPNGITTERVCKATRKTPQELGDTFESLLAKQKILGFAGLWMSAEAFAVGSVKLTETLKTFHEAAPGEAFFSQEAVAKEAGLKWSGKPLDRILTKLEEAGLIETDSSGIRLKEAILELSPRQTSLLARVVEAIEAGGINPPNPHTIAQSLGIPRQAIEEILRLGLRSGQVVQISEVVFYTPAQIENLKQKITEFANGEPFTSNDLRDALQTTRKYSLPLLDYFDEIGYTVKRGTHRVILKQGE